MTNQITSKLLLSVVSMNHIKEWSVFIIYLTYYFRIFLRYSILSKLSWEMSHDINHAWSFDEEIDWNRLKIKWKLCQKVTNGGITGFKQHLAHVASNITGCLEVSNDVSDQMRNLLKQSKQKKVQIKVKREQ